MAIQKIRVINTDNDLKGNSLFSQAQKIASGKLTSIKTTRVYRLEGVTENQAKKIAEKLFCEDINQKYFLNSTEVSPLKEVRPLFLEIAYKSGVMNPEVASIIKAASDLGITLKAADSSWEYGFYGKLTRDEARRVIESLRLFNSIVEHIVESDPETLLIKEIVGSTNIIPIREMSDEQLLETSKDKLFLNLEEMKVIQNYFNSVKRDPTDCELETLAQTWSEHCVHKTFKANLIVDGKKKKPLMQRIKEEAFRHDKNIVSAFHDNSGVMEFYDGLAICGKAETHNSPAAIEPYGGAATGSGGVYRDIVGTGQGAKCIVSTDIFCLAPPDMDSRKLPEGCLPPDYLLRRVVDAVRDYGNRMGIPTNNGSFHFHNDFRAKPTVLVGAYGIIPKSKAQKGQVKVGDAVVSVGGRTGRDGIHGATFSSGEMTERTINVNSSAVQIGNAIEEKRTFDAILEARDLGLIRAITDVGGGGFSSAIGEMGEKTGVKVDLEKAKLKYQGLAPWEIWISESQERMIIGLPKKNLKKFLEICQKYNVEASVMGVFDGSKKLKVYHGKQKVAELQMEFLHHGLPQRTMVATKPQSHPGGEQSSPIGSIIKDSIGRSSTSLQNDKSLKKLLADWNICSKEPVVRLYDHSVQGTNALQPFGGEYLDGPNDAAVIRPILNKDYGMVISHGLNPVLNNVDPYYGSIWAATEAIANYVAVGGDYKNASLINNYSWPFPDEESLWALDRCVDGVVDFMKALKIPVISGKDSLASTYRGKDGTVIKIPPVLCISAFGRIPDVKKTVTSDFKKIGSTVILVGEIKRIDLKKLPNALNSIYQGIQKGEILACHDVSEGGAFVSLFEMCVGGNMGAEVRPLKRSDLFLETAGCFVVEVENEETARKLFKGVTYKILGRTTKEKNILDVPLDDLKKAWQKPMKEFFG